MTIALLVLLILAGAFFYRLMAKQKHRKALLESMLMEGEWGLIASRVPMIAKLPQDLRAALEGKINLFLDQVEFIGCNGLELTDEIELSIAAQACVLVVNTDAWYDNLTTILVYPSAFKSKQTTYNGYVATEEEVVRLGESWTRGPVILSWEHSARGAANPDDGHNVVLHEFAHQLDDLSGHTDGAPVLHPSQSFADWERVFVKGHKRHQHAVERGHDTVLDPYGAQNHQEFFAVAVEAFFEKPLALREKEPAIYQQISSLLRLDPAEW